MIDGYYHPDLNAVAVEVEMNSQQFSVVSDGVGGAYVLVSITY